LKNIERKECLMRIFTCLAAVLLLAGITTSPQKTTRTPRFTEGAVNAKSYSKLTFSPDGALFLADSIGARIYALDLGDRESSQAVAPLNIEALGAEIGALIGADPADVLVHDMAVNPVSQNTYLIVSRGKRAMTSRSYLPNDVANANVLLRISPAGRLEEVRLDRVKHSTLDIANPVGEASVVSWKRTKERVDAVSDMVFHDGKLFVAGLSNEEFSSAMRIYPFPFEGPGATTTLEIYHGSHAQYETDSPVRAFLPYRLRGKSYLLAAYLCTPVVLFPMEALRDKTHVKGTTIAELGANNYPVDMVAYRSRGRDYVMVANTSRGLMRAKVEDLERPVTPITSRAAAGTGTPFERLDTQGVVQVENYGNDYLLLLTNDRATGELRLSTMRTDR
jgi:hypothetical protein